MSSLRDIPFQRNKKNIYLQGKPHHTYLQVSKNHLQLFNFYIPKKKNSAKNHTASQKIKGQNKNKNKNKKK